ncbi:MAG: 3-phosphoshikimate 1-carboxyvinyltransferase [Bacteroidaceae bacterium]|nr:3-phosphoshikimate 1-carboxyvinyltransferase [Bacteroidaceae bacterium]
MSITILPPSVLRHSAHLPASKSISNRALLIAALVRYMSARTAEVGEGLENLSDCDDTQAMQQALATSSGVIDIGAAGTAMRFMTAYLAVVPGTRTITGSKRMQHRPIGVLVDALRQLGAHIDYAGEEGFPPLRISGGGLRGGHLSVAGNVSSQYVSALLMIGPVLEEGLTLALDGDIVSRPYIEMTLAMMRTFGATAWWRDATTIRVEPGGYRLTDYRVESDWSAASYWYEMMALTDDEEAEVILPGLCKDSLQGDSAVAEMFRPLGVCTEYLRNAEGHEAVRLSRGPRMAGQFDMDFQHQPDLAQTFVVTCAMRGIPFRFTGLQSLKIKETDRISALRNELRKLGCDIKEEGEGILAWQGERCTATDSAIDTYEDHRMAMAFAPASLTRNRLCINNPEVVAKSYPAFWDDLAAAGFVISADTEQLTPLPHQ